MTYREAIYWLYSTQLFGMKLGLETSRKFLHHFSLSHPTQKIFHVAGTNGKGSVCAMLESILKEAGYTTGLFTSPHLVTFRERIRIRGEIVSEDYVAAALTEIKEHIRSWEPHPTFFEIAFALALQSFQDHQVDTLILETGMGGRFDATNALTPTVSVITPISLDHQKWLGNSLAEIAQEKAGIIKPTIPVVSAKQLPAAKKIIQKTAAQQQAPLHFVDTPYPHRTNLPGKHQQENAALALAAITHAPLTIAPGTVRHALQNIHWKGRFQHIPSTPPLILDGAHNPHATATLVHTWKNQFLEKKATILFGAVKGKHTCEVLTLLKPIAARFLFTNVNSVRHLPTTELTALLQKTGNPTVSCQSFSPSQKALDQARTWEEPILVTGSLFLVGEILAQLEEASPFEKSAQ